MRRSWSKLKAVIELLRFVCKKEILGIDCYLVIMMREDVMTCQERSKSWDHQEILSLRRRCSKLKASIGLLSFVCKKEVLGSSHYLVTT